jgi:hypothetical protein
MIEIKSQQFDTWKIGSLNTSGVKIKHIFYRKEKHYLIYESDISSLVSSITNPDLTYEKKLLQFEKEFSLIKGLLINSKQRKRFLPRIASAMHTCFEDEKVITQQIISDVLSSIKNYKIIKGRLQYLLGSIFLGLFILIISYISSLNNSYPLGTSSLMFNTVLFGISGGFLSISTNLNKIEIDIECGTTLLYLITGSTRIIISIISSIIIYYLIDSGLILVSLLNNSNRESIIYVFAALSGFSERFIPNILSRFSNSTITK